MSTTSDAQIIKEIMQEIIVGNYISYATLTVLVYDLGMCPVPADMRYYLHWRSNIIRERGTSMIKRVSGKHRKLKAQIDRQNISGWEDIFYF